MEKESEREKVRGRNGERERGRKGKKGEMDRGRK